jgi:hypothetical protein
MLVAWRAERQSPAEPGTVAGFPPERIAALLPEQRRRLPLLNDRCVDLVDRVAS